MQTSEAQAQFGPFTPSHVPPQPFEHVEPMQVAEAQAQFGLQLLLTLLRELLLTLLTQMSFTFLPVHALSSVPMPGRDSHFLVWLLQPR
jgi:hypothetical protein